MLELLVYMTALDARSATGEPIYNDVMSGVCIDWDGEIHPYGQEADTENEIDVMMMHNMVPVFVSCKNGEVDMDELYKLQTVARRFGGEYAKMVLIATSLDESSSSNGLRQRAKDMSIRLVDGLSEMSDAALRKLVREFWKKGEIGKGEA